VPDLRHPPSGCRFHPRCPYAMDICKTKEPPMYKPEGDSQRGAFCWLLTKKSGE
jgi:oligopeptide/dipeptide ABC transporter ATP-binding protein